MKMSIITLTIAFFTQISWGVKPSNNISIKQEIERSLDAGLKWLSQEQNASSGNWGLVEYPALTGLAVRSFLGHHQLKLRNTKSLFVKGWSLFAQKFSRTALRKGLVFDTSICMMALMQAKNSNDELITKVQENSWLINNQTLIKEADNFFDGGVGYGRNWLTRSSILILQWKLSFTKKTYKNNEQVIDLDWDAAIAFVSKCQNLPSTNNEKWVSGHPEDKGGFVYFPGSSMAGERENTNGSIALRSYGSMSYAGLLSFIYAEMDSDDPRVVAVRDWLTKHYTIKENPGMGPQGLYYYYHTMSKALSHWNHEIKNEKVRAGLEEELSLHLLNLQSGNGSWTNDNVRWWEKDPVLVTSYALPTLQRIYYTL